MVPTHLVKVNLRKNKPTRQIPIVYEAFRFPRIYTKLILKCLGLSVAGNDESVEALIKQFYFHFQKMLLC